MLSENEPTIRELIQNRNQHVAAKVVTTLSSSDKPVKLIDFISEMHRCGITREKALQALWKIGGHSPDYDNDPPTPPTVPAIKPGDITIDISKVDLEKWKMAS